ncbi:Similar to Beta-scruin (Limulus polyphemus) [Cotesia congregata]|uniref:Similar to Beta-scruin (Limulus polyphemus) n=1 Tax=Cotesia congregata TaxID=51543 RepID=A0A8J2H9L5_COTCN|nr:Similar to Beta-scruin (Limulus polyphemus) [Cotesia congregata]
MLLIVRLDLNVGTAVSPHSLPLFHINSLQPYLHITSFNSLNDLCTHFDVNSLKSKICKQAQKKNSHKKSQSKLRNRPKSSDIIKVTFPAKKYLRGSKSRSGDGDGRRSTNQSGNIIRRSEWKLGKEEKNGTPRILRVIRRHSCKGDYKDKFKDRDKSPSVCLEEDKSKSSVVLLHHDKDQHQEQEQEQELSLFNLSLKYEPLNVNIIQQTPECRSCKSNPNDPASNQMALHHQPINQKPSRKLDDTKRVFPFRPTPSGNLKVIPNQVVFETNRVSVLVADPKYTKVNVKAELTKSDPSFHQDLQSQSIKQSQEFEAGNFLQQAKSSQASSEYIPRTQPYRVKHRCPEMDPNNRNGAQHQSRINHENLNQVPLASYKNADCAIKIGNDEFHCHLLVLQSYSRFFDEKNSKDIDLTEVGSVNRKDCSTKTRMWFSLSLIRSFVILFETDKKECSDADDRREMKCDTHFRTKSIEKLLGQTIKLGEQYPSSQHGYFLTLRHVKLIDLRVDSVIWTTLYSSLLFIFLPLDPYLRSSVTSKAFSIIYDWMISESNESCQLLRRDNILEIFMAAQFLGIKELEEQCWAFIDNNDLFSEDTAFLLYVEARKLGNTPVMELMVPRIMNEMEVLMSAVRWLMHDWETRRQYMLSVLKCVRFGLIAPWQLVEVKRNPENPEFMELMSNPEVQKMVDDGLAFVIIKHWYGNQTEDYYRWIDLLGLTEPTSRNWAGEDKNYVTYQEFLLYLEDYQRSMMLELKSRKGKSNSNTSTNTNQKSECSEAKTWVNYYQSQNLGVETTNGQVAPAPNNGTRSWKFKKMPPPPISERIGSEAPEFLNKYLSRLDGNRTKVDAQPKDNEQEKKIREIGNAAVNLDIRRNDELKMSQVNYQNQQIQIQQCLTSLCEPNSLPPKKLSYPTNYCLASGDNQIRGKPGSIGQNERIKVAQLLSADQKNTFGQSSNDSDDKNLDMMETLQSTSDGEKIAKSYCVSIANNAINQIDACKPIEMIKPPNFLYNSDDKTGSISVSYSSTDIDDSYSPNNHKNLTINNNNNNNNITKETKVTMNKKLICPNESLFLNEQPTVIVFGGIDPHQEYGVAGNTGKNIYRLKPLENIWEFVGEMPEPRHHHSVVYFKGRLYVAGGADPRENSLQRKNSVVGTVWSYDPASRKWFTEPAMLTPRKNFGLVVCDGKIFAVGGEDNNGVTLRSVEAFDPAKKIWKKMQPMNIARVGLAATTFENLIWVAGGISNSITDPLLKEVECYDPCKKSWTKIESLPSARCYACLCVISDNLFLVGGAGKSSTDDNMTESIPTVDIWEPSSRNWQQISKMSTARHNHSISSIDNQLLVIGGVTTVHMKTLKSVECFCCRRNKWIKGVASLPYPILGHSSVSLPPSDYFSNS